MNRESEPYRFARIEGYRITLARLEEQFKDRAVNLAEMEAAVAEQLAKEIEALMFVYFLAQLLCALIERQLRNAMRQNRLPHIQILPEDRPSATPTIEQLVRVFSVRYRHLLLSKDGQLLQTFTDPLTPIQQQILDLLSISPKAYA